MTRIRKFNRKTGEWESVPPPRIDPMEWPFLILFGTIGLLILAGSVAGLVLIVERLT